MQHRAFDGWIVVDVNTWRTMRAFPAPHNVDHGPIFRSLLARVELTQGFADRHATRSMVHRR